MTNIFNVGDMGVLAIILISVLVGVMRGFTREFFGIIAWIGSIVIAVFTMSFFKPMIAQYIKDDFIASVVSGLVIYIISFVVLGIIVRYVSSKVKEGILGGADRSLGLVFGLARGILGLVLIFIFMSLVSSPAKWPTMVKEARSISYIEAGANYLQNLVPERFYDSIGGKKKFQTHFASHDMTPEELVRSLSQPQAAFQNNAPEVPVSEADKVEDKK